MFAKNVSSNILCDNWNERQLAYTADAGRIVGKTNAAGAVNEIFEPHGFHGLLLAFLESTAR